MSQHACVQEGYVDMPVLQMSLCQLQQGDASRWSYLQPEFLSLLGASFQVK